MSQFWQGVTAGSLPPSIVEEVDTQDGNAVPVAHVLLFNAYDSSENNDNGIVTKGGTAGGDPPGTGASNEIDVYLTNRVTGQVTTTDSTLTTIATLSLGASPGTFIIYGDVIAFKSAATAAGATYTFVGGAQTNGVAATEFGVEYHDTFEALAFSAGGADIFVSTSGNNLIVQVQGFSASINWNCLLEYRQVN